MKPGAAPHDLSTIESAIIGLQRSSRRSVPFFLVGIACTLLAAGVAGYFILKLSADLKQAHSSLQQSNVALSQARVQLSQVQQLLRQHEKLDRSATEVAQVKNLISKVASTQNNLQSASASVSSAANQINVAQQDTQGFKGFGGAWIDQQNNLYRIRQDKGALSYTEFMDDGSGRVAAEGTVKGSTATYTAQLNDQSFTCSARLAGDALSIVETCTNQDGVKQTNKLTRR